MASTRGNVRGISIKKTPIWKYLREYKKLHDTNEVLAEIYLLESVPEQLQEQVKETVYQIHKRRRDEPTQGHGPSECRHGGV